MPKRICTVLGCINTQNGRGYCGKHYARWKKHGDPLVVKYATTKSARVDSFLQGGTADCRHHGSHTDWALRTRTDARGQPYRSLECALCIRARARAWRERNPELHKKAQGTLTVTASRLVSGAKSRAKKQGIDCDITREWVINKFNEQGGKCAMSGIPFQMAYEMGGRREHALSLDQIVPSGGYTEKNTQLVVWAVNEMKKRMPLQKFVGLCCAIAHHVQE